MLQHISYVRVAVAAAMPVIVITVVTAVTVPVVIVVVRLVPPLLRTVLVIHRISQLATVLIVLLQQQHM